MTLYSVQLIYFNHLLSIKKEKRHINSVYEDQCFNGDVMQIDSSKFQRRSSRARKLVDKFILTDINIRKSNQNTQIDVSDQGKLTPLDLDIFFVVPGNCDLRSGPLLSRYGPLARLIPIKDNMLREMVADEYPSYQTERMASPQSIGCGRTAGQADPSWTSGSAPTIIGSLCGEATDHDL